MKNSKSEGWQRGEGPYSRSSGGKDPIRQSKDYDRAGNAGEPRWQLKILDNELLNREGSAKLPEECPVKKPIEKPIETPLERAEALIREYGVLNERAEALIEAYVGRVKAPGVPRGVIRQCGIDAWAQGYSDANALRRLRTLLQQEEQAKGLNNATAD